VITDMILGAFASVAEFFVSLLPDIAPPTELESGFTGAVATVMGFVGGFGAWVPFGHAGIALGVVLTVFVVAGGIKLTRIVASFLTAGGGSAG
jgi:hypothetical protein